MGVPFPRGFVAILSKQATPGCGSSSVVHAGLGCALEDDAEWLDGAKRHSATCKVATIDPA